MKYFLELGGNYEYRTYQILKTHSTTHTER